MWDYLLEKICMDLQAQTVAAYELLVLKLDIVFSPLLTVPFSQRGISANQQPAYSNQCRRARTGSGKSCLDTLHAGMQPREILAALYASFKDAFQSSLMTVFKRQRE